eukprot:CAMPEP_0171462576 /NCGR_PEP_ID=MMETSP0945-20130129/6557_1 /TAXON_ID=109269 /ORGANISM="Vaucheria litorea, Strain CCMP2940" /LENGTH=670 /DNA_ID=CAMNT_0011989127 /DNA_START=515 /DNA_END=2527 /DNA_ORIENTATION=-
MANLLEGSSRMWGTIVFWYLFVIIVLYFFWMEWQVYLPLRREFLMKGDIDTSQEYRYTLLIEDIPEVQRSSVLLHSYFNRLFPGQIVVADLYLNTEKLEEVIEERETFLIKYEKEYAKKGGDPNVPNTQIKLGKHFLCCGGEKIDSLEYYQSEINRLNEEAEMEYEKIVEFGKELSSFEELKISSYGAIPDSLNWVNQGVQDMVGGAMDLLHIHKSENNSNPEFREKWRKTVSSTGFVTFKCLSVKQAAAQCKLSNMPYTFSTQPAPEPNDMIWSNVTRPLGAIRLMTKFSNAFWIIAMLFWAIPVTFTQAIANLEGIRQSLPWLYIPNQEDYLYGVISGYLPVLTLLILMTLLPMAIEYSATKVIRFKSKSEVDNYIFLWHFGFEIANLWLVLIGGSIFNQLSSMINEPTNTLEYIASAVPGASQFFLNIIINNTLAGLPFELSLMYSVIFNGIYRRIKKEKFLSQREIEEMSQPEPLALGETYPPIIFVMLISFVYAGIVPIILPFAALYFALSYLVYKHQVLHVYGQDAEGGAAYFPQLYNFLIACLYTAEVIMNIYLGIKLGKKQASLAFFAIVFTYMVDRYIRKNYASSTSTLSLEAAREADIQDGYLETSPEVNTNQVFKTKGGTCIGMNNDLEYTQPVLRRGKWETEPMPYREEDNDDKTADC